MRDTHRSILAGIALSVFGGIITPAHADEPAKAPKTPTIAPAPTTAVPPTSASTTPAVASVVAAKYPQLRVGDLAPEFTFPVLQRDTVWSSRDVLGKQPLLFMAMFEGIMMRVGAEKVVSQNASIWLLDHKGELAKAFGAHRNIVVAIDRAGFIRRAEIVTDTVKIPVCSIPLPHNLVLPFHPLYFQPFSDPTPKLELGAPAPDFSLPDMNGNVRRLSDLRGQKNVLLTFFPKCFTGGCTNHLSSIRDQQATFEANDTQVWAVSVDPAGGEQGQLAFAKELKLKFPLLPDVGRNLSLLYGAAQTPQDKAARMSVLIDKNGIVRDIDREVKLLTHGKDVLTRMQQLDMMAKNTVK